MIRIQILRSFARAVSSTGHSAGDFLERARARRKGSTIVVVIALMGILSLLGLMFFTFATQEQENALNFSEAARLVDNPALDADVYFNWALRQIIVGPEYSEKNSVLWGGRHAILSNLFGHDATPYNGQPFSISLDGATNYVIVDMDGDGIDDTVEIPGQDSSEWPSLADFVDSPVANFSPLAGFPFERVVTAFPEPDVDYTYADINNAYLAQISYTRNPATGRTELVIKPSYHRPELFAEPDGSGGVQRDPDWATDPRWVKRLMRPHPLHVHVPQQIVPGQTYSRRFLDDANAADAAIIFSSLPGTSGGFPFLVDVDGDGIFNEQGVWSRQGTGGPPVNYEFDLDNFRDGFRDSILMDLDFPVQIRSSDDARYIAMFSPLIIDADSLFNLNIHGNLAGNTAPATFTTPTLGGAVLNWNKIALSSLGLTPAEVNLMWGFDAIPGSGDFVSSASPFEHLKKYFGATVDPQDRWVLANMLHWWLNKGAVEYGTTGADDRVIAGRLGEASKVEELRQAAGGGSIIAFNQGDNRWYFPYPGIFNRDDNRDFNEGGTQTYHIPAGAVDVGGPNVGRAQALPFSHPLSLSGRGLFWSYGNNPALQMYQPPAASGNPSQWLQYNGMGIAGDVRWRNLLGGNLMLNTQFGVHGFADTGPDGRLFTADDIPFDDMMEIILENDYLQRPHGEPFTWEDAAAIMMSSGDVSNTGIQSRAIDLLAPLFDTQNCNRAVDIRRMYTTQSWDRKQFPLARLFGAGPDGSPGRAPSANFDGDDNDNGIVDDAGEYGWPGSDDARAWEFNHDVDQDGKNEFPPEFSGGTGIETAYYGYHQDNTPDPALFNSLGTIATDPFRPQLRRLLEAEWGNRSDLRLQFRLDVNQVLDVVHAGNQRPGHPYYSPLEYRPLSPHSGDSALTSVHTVEGFYDPASPNLSQLPPYPPQNAQQAEFWARYDRQRMARDIYVMLYTLCGGYDFSDSGAGNDGTFPDHALAPNGGRAVYTNTQLRQMAQFAVNMVDALDRDNVTTAFEYDTNLADGWGLDDQPWVAGGPPAATPAAARTGDPTPGDRAVVYGVETQSLTFSETLWVYQAQYTGAMAMDNPRTMYDETAGDHHFLYAELRSVSPEATKLALPSVSTSKANAIWRVRRITGDATAVPSNPPLNPTPPQQLDADTRANLPAPDNAVYFLSDSGNVQSVSPGGLFSIATGDNYSAGATSDLYVDHDADAEFDLIVPRRLGTTPVMGSGGLLPYCDLDLVHTNHQPKFALDNGSTGDFLNRIAPATSPMTLLLERRMNPDLPNLPLSANPWIVVDTNIVNRRNFNLLETDDTELEVRTKLANLDSEQRAQPLDGANIVVHTGDPATGMSFRFNSIKPASAPVDGNNRGTGIISPFNLIQMHFNRDFASVAELFSVPLRSPRHLTRSIVGAGRVPETQRRAATGPDMAGPMFLMPTHPTNTNFNNHWHRLLGLVEVPTRMHRQLGNPLNFTRVPGRINLNTLRHPEVMAGLTDDTQLHFEPERQRAPGVDSNGNGTIDGVRDRNTTGTVRDYWFDTLLTRDGVDPISGLVLPGTTASRPFRDAGILTGRPLGDPARGVTGQDSLLRAHPNSTTTTGNATATDRHLFDTGVELGLNNAGEDLDLDGILDPGEDLNGNGVLDLATNYYLKNRLLSKLTGNTTTRSNVFFVYLTVRFHEVYEDPATGAVRIGGRFDLNGINGTSDDEHRALFVLDRSDAEKAYEPATGTFRWEEIVKHRVPIN